MEPSIVCISETWLNDSVQLTAFNGCDYSVFRHDREVTVGGGVLIAVSNRLKSVEVSKFSFNTCECIFVDIWIRNSVSFRTGCVYRPPNATLEDSMNLFECIYSQLETCIHFMVYGDFNLNDIDWSILTATSCVSNEFLQVYFRLGANQCVHFPTRNDNFLDLVLCSDINLIREMICHEPFSLSDHSSILFSIQCQHEGTTPSQLKPCFAKADYELINAYLLTLDWTEIYALCTSAEDYYSVFQNTLQNVILNFVPFTSSNTHKGVPWFTSRLKYLRRAKQRCWRRYMHSKNIVKLAKYRESAEKYRYEFYRLKREYEEHIFGDKDVNPKQFFNYVRRQTSNKLKNCLGLTSLSPNMCSSYSRFSL